MTLDSDSRGVRGWRGERATARVQLALGVAGPAALVALLPSPAGLLRQVSDGSDAVTVLGAAMMLAVTVVVWGLLAWALLVATATLLARMPGSAGRLGRFVARSLTPRAARRVVILATGVSLVTGVSACATPSDGPGQVGGAAVAVAPAAAPFAAGSGSASHVGGYAGSGSAPGTTRVAVGPGLRIDLDWPAEASAGGAAVGTPATGGDGVADDRDATNGTAPTTSAPTRTASPAVAPPAPVSSAPSGSQATVDDASPGSGAAPTGPSAAAPPVASSTPTPSAAPGTPSATSRPAATDDDPAASPSHRPPSPPVPPAPAPSGSISPATTTGHAPGAPRHAPTTVTVRSGDTLWTIAAHQLPAGASAAQIDAAWRAWYATNRDVIGADPDLILPGQQLTSPDLEGSPS